MKKRMMKICYMMTLAAVLCTSGTTGVTGIKSVYAAENEVQERAATTNGVLNLNNGPASITIKGNDGQSLKGKRFLVYQLFQAENAKGMESINYTFNPEYKKFVCYIVGQRIHKDERNVTEYEVIDYIQSLNTHQTEGAQTAQEKEITKVNEKGKTLEGAEFTLYEDAEGTKVVSKIVTDNTGVVTTDPLEVEKKYYLKETKAPQGYRIPKDINGNDYVYEIYTKINDKRQYEYYVNGEVHTKDSGDYAIEGTPHERIVNLKVENHTGLQMPETGTHTTLLIVLLGVEYKKAQHDAIKQELPSARELIFFLLPFLFAAIAIGLYLWNRRETYEDGKI